MTLDGIATAADTCGLDVLGAFHPTDNDPVPHGTGTVVLLGPKGRAFWPVFTRSPEYNDGAADPLDRWSVREIGALARKFRGTAHFPFGGPPWLPFIDWARRSGAWTSPVGLLVHERHGLFVSYRGAISVKADLDVPTTAVKPCDSCAKPCLTACPVGALGHGSHDAAACHAWLDQPEGRDCIMRGCAVRRSCPIGENERPEAQSAFHMAAFHVTHGP